MATKKITIEYDTELQPSIEAFLDTKRVPVRGPNGLITFDPLYPSFEAFCQEYVGKLLSEMVQSPPTTTIRAKQKDLEDEVTKVVNVNVRTS